MQKLYNQRAVVSEQHRQCCPMLQNRDKLMCKQYKVESQTILIKFENKWIPQKFAGRHQRPQTTSIELPVGSQASERPANTFSALVVLLRVGSSQQYGSATFPNVVGKVRIQKNPRIMLILAHLIGPSSFATDAATLRVRISFLWLLILEQDGSETRRRVQISQQPPYSCSLLFHMATN